MKVPPRSEKRLWLGAFSVAALGILLLLHHVSCYSAYMLDDAYIALRYAERFLNGLGLTWTDGPPVEGYSDLLWILIVSGLGALGFEMSTALRTMGIVFMSSIILILSLLYRPRAISQFPPLLVGVLALSFSAPIAYWARSGLEQPLVAALLSWAIASTFPLLKSSEEKPYSFRNVWPAAVPYALLCWTRPDTPLFVVAAGIALLGVHGLHARGVGLVLKLSSLSVGAVGLQLFFRIFYYDDWLPNTAYVKVGLSVPWVLASLEVLGRTLRPFAVLWVALMAALIVFRRDSGKTRRRLFFLIVLFSVWTLYSYTLGADHWVHRSFVPCIVIMVFVGVETLRWCDDRRGFVRWATWVVLLLVPPAFLHAQWRDPQNRKGLVELPELTWKRFAVGETLREAFEKEAPLLAVDSAGIIPYVSKLPALDMLGLNDRHLARQRPEDFGEGMRGHELGSGDYVLRRKPDLIVWGLAGDIPYLAYRGGAELSRDPRYREQYLRIHVEGSRPRSSRFYLWVRREGRVGIRRTEKSVFVPGYLLAAEAGVVARFDQERVLGTTIEPGQEARFEGLKLPAGAWSVRLATTGSSARFSVLRQLRKGSLESVKQGRYLRVSSGQQPITFSISVPPGSGNASHLQGLLFTQRSKN